VVEVLINLDAVSTVVKLRPKFCDLIPGVSSGYGRGIRDADDWLDKPQTSELRAQMGLYQNDVDQQCSSLPSAHLVCISSRV
jgi:hypothetical protein